MINKGYFVIADITGYTEFLTNSGLEEAQGILDHLFEGLLRAFRPPLIISNFQGDAIFAYAPEGSFTQAQTFIELLESIYMTFAHLVERMEQTASCGCDACDYLPRLDLKIIVHYGRYATQHLMGREELSGPDVILVHRMTKNTVKEETGIQSYALFSRAAIDALDLNGRDEEMRVLKGQYEHLGEVSLYVYNLRTRYDALRVSHRIFIAPGEARLYLECNLPVAPPLVWEYLTQPQYIKVWMSFEYVDPAGELVLRVTNGTTFRCARQTENMAYTVLDWRPFDYVTFEAIGWQEGEFQATFSLMSLSTGTLCRFYWKPLQNAFGSVEVEAIRQVYIDSLTRLQELIASHLAQGKILPARIDHANT